MFLRERLPQCAEQLTAAASHSLNGVLHERTDGFGVRLRIEPAIAALRVTNCARVLHQRIERLCIPLQCRGEIETRDVEFRCETHRFALRLECDVGTIRSYVDQTVVMPCEGITR